MASRGRTALFTHHSSGSGELRVTVKPTVGTHDTIETVAGPISGSVAKKSGTSSAARLVPSPPSICTACIVPPPGIVVVVERYFARELAANSRSSVEPSGLMVIEIRLPPVTRVPLTVIPGCHCRISDSPKFALNISEARPKSKPWNISRPVSPPRS
eukprot:2347422-Rhodomonas_salina.1